MSKELQNRLEAAELKLQQAQNKIAEMREAMNKLKTVWDLQDGDTYYRTRQSIYKDTWDGSLIDLCEREVGNAFLTREEATKERARRTAETKIVKRIAELNDGWKPDWSNTQSKYFVEYNHYENILETENSQGYKGFEDKFYLVSNELTTQLIQELGHELKLWLGVNDE